jgi:hypothetical protein
MQIPNYLCRRSPAAGLRNRLNPSSMTREDGDAYFSKDLYEDVKAGVQNCNAACTRYPHDIPVTKALQAVL